MDVAELNQLRKTVKGLWDAPGDQPRPFVWLVDEEADREEVSGALKTMSSEIGIRHMRLDLSEGLTDAHRAALARRSPRMIVITGIEHMPVEQRATLHAELVGGGRTLPVVVGFAPADDVRRTTEAWRSLRDAKIAREERMRLVAEEVARNSDATLL